MTMAMPIAFGTKLSVASWICVTDWNSETPKPMASAVSRIGAQSLAASSIACRPSSMTVWSFMRSPRSPVARDEGVHDQTPPVDQDEEQQLERQRDGDRGSIIMPSDI